MEMMVRRRRRRRRRRREEGNEYEEEEDDDDDDELLSPAEAPPSPDGATAGVFSELVALFAEQHGRPPNGVELAQWRRVLSEATALRSVTDVKETMAPKPAAAPVVERAAAAAAPPPPPLGAAWAQETWGGVNSLTSRQNEDKHNTI